MKLNYLLLIILFNFIKLNKSQCPFSQNIIKGASATFYTSIDNGNCGYEKLTGPLGPGNTMIAALGSKLYQNGLTCGQCYKITNSQNVSITVMATDSCHDAGYCQRDNHFDLSPNAFEVLGKPEQGVLENLSYMKVPCQVNGNIKIMMKDGSNPYWTAFFIYNSKITIKTVSVRMSNENQFRQLVQTSYNYYPTQISGTNFEVKIESIGGEFIYITIPSVESRRIYDTNSQFSTSGCSFISQKPIFQTNSPIAQTKTPIAQTNSPIAQTKTPISQTNSPTTQTKSPIYNYCPNFIQNSPSTVYLDSDDFENSNSSIKLLFNIFNIIIIFINILIIY